MRNHNNGHAVLNRQVLDRGVQFLGHQRVKPGGRLVEQQHLARGAERAAEQHALLLSARERAVILLCKGRHTEHVHVGARRRLLCAAVEGQKPGSADAAREHDLAHACGKVALRARLLRHIADAACRAGVCFHAARVGRGHAEDGLHQRGFARAVFADDGEKFALVHGKAHIVQRQCPLVADGQIFADDHIHQSSTSFKTSIFFAISER